MMNTSKGLTFCQAILQLGYDSFHSLNSALQTQNRRAGNSLWGKMCLSMFGINRERKRTLLYTTWMKNRGQIRDLVAAKMSDKGELTKSDDRVVDQGRGDSCIESSSMFDIPLSTEEVDLDISNVEVATTSSIRDLDNTIIRLIFLKGNSFCH